MDSVTFQMKATELVLSSGAVYCGVQAGLTFTFLDEILACDHTSERFCMWCYLLYCTKW